MINEDHERHGQGATAAGAWTWSRPAQPRSVLELRERARAFAEAHGADRATVSALGLAVSEGVTNAVMHAFQGREPGTVTVTCEAGAGELHVSIADDGRGMQLRSDSPGLGAGLSTMGQLAARMDVRPNPSGGGTVVDLAFHAAEVHSETAGMQGLSEERLLVAASELARSAAWPLEGFERLCDLVVDAFADAACVDVAEYGCLRRLAARVHGDAGLSARLEASSPPLRPGTATWAALHGDGPQLVVHDPSIPRSPVGVGTMLDLSWWLSVPLADANGAVLGLWGLGGRTGRPVPEEATIALIAEAGVRAAGGLAHARVLAAMQATRSRLEAVLSALGEAVSVTDATGGLVYANDAAARLRGAASAHELMAVPADVWRRRVHVTGQHGEELALDPGQSRRLQRGEHVEGPITRSVDKLTGRVRWLRTTSRALDGPDGSLVVDIVEDVTQAVGAEHRQRGMIEVGKLLEEPSDLIPALQAVTELLAPELADGCAIDLLDSGGALRRVALFHPDGEQCARMRDLEERWPASLGSPVLATLGTAGPHVVHTVTDEALRADACDEEHLAALREIGVRSMIAVPLRAAGRAIGLLTLTHDRHSGRSFEAADAESFGDMGRRVATAAALARQWT